MALDRNPIGVNRANWIQVFDEFNEINEINNNNNNNNNNINSLAQQFYERSACQEENLNDHPVNIGLMCCQNNNLKQTKRKYRYKSVVGQISHDTGCPLIPYDDRKYIFSVQYLWSVKNIFYFMLLPLSWMYNCNYKQFLSG